MPSPRPTPSPIVRVFNRDVGRFHGWCTPSIPPEQERVEDFYGSDISISAGFFGTLVDHDGIFGEAERIAAAAQGADRTMFSAHGSSGSHPDLPESAMAAGADVCGCRVPDARGAWRGGARARDPSHRRAEGGPARVAARPRLDGRRGRSARTRPAGIS